MTDLAPAVDSIRDVVTIDGPSGAGKSTVAKAVARQLGFVHLDTGAMYRATALHLIEQGLSEPLTEQSIATGLATLRLDLDDEGLVSFGDRALGARLRERDVEALVSPVAASAAVRERMLDEQRRFAQRRPCVVEGRDMGTVVFPAARWKIFLDASVDERARRRYEDFVAAGREVELDEVRREIARRDDYDRSRDIAPLCAAEEATVVDSTGLGIGEVVQRIVAEVDAGQSGFVGMKNDPYGLRPWFYLTASFLARIYFRVFHGLKVHGIEQVPLRGGVLLASNHSSYFDPPLIAIVNRRYVRSLGRSTLAINKVAHWILAACGTLFLDRDGSAKDGILLATGALKRGEALTVFPEGTRSRDGEVGPFKRGILLMLGKEPVLVVPVGMRGTFGAYPKGKLFPRPVKIEVVFGAPMMAAEVRAPGGLDELRRRVVALSTGSPVLGDSSGGRDSEKG